MRDLVDLFWVKYGQLKRAVDNGEETAVVVMDREVDFLLESIFERQAANVLEIQMQFLVAIELLKKEAEDRCCVLRHTKNLQRVLERHILPSAASDVMQAALDLAPETTAELDSPGDQGLLDVALLESLSNRVAVITPDYRYLFTNSANAMALEREPSQIVGRHIGEFIGLHRFVQGVKATLDRCFAGEIADFTYADQVNGRTVVIRSRISPYYAMSGELVGALVLMEEIADRRQSQSSAA